MPKLDPTKLECRALFGYGTGYFLAESHTKAVAGGDGGTYCDRCPIKGECWDDHRAKIDTEYPVQVKAFGEARILAEKNGINGGQFAAACAAAGMPDPYLGAMLDNLQRGQKDRGGARKTPRSRFRRV
jgi:hypothetical protein